MEQEFAEIIETHRKTTFTSLIKNPTQQLTRLSLLSVNHIRNGVKVTIFPLQ